MFWPLLLAHLLADYPLQTDRMVQAKKTWPGLFMHVAVHLVTLLVTINGLLGLDWRSTLPTILTVTLLHFAIDAWKNLLTRWRPRWVLGSYLQDQLLHVLVLLLVGYGQARSSGASPFAGDTPWIIYAIGYLLVTHVWFVTERVFAYRDKLYQQWVNTRLWPRMAIRAALFSVLLIGWNLLGVVVVIGALAGYEWSISHQYRWRGLLIDSAVVVLVLLLLQAAPAPAGGLVAVFGHL